MFRRRIVVVLLVMLVVLVGIQSTQAQAAWAPNTAYAVNALVTYGGSTYKCIQAHTSQVGWEPPNVPALWSLQTGTSPTATKTRTNTPSAPTNTPSGATATKTKTPVATATKTNTPAGTQTGFSAILTEAQFNAWFPNRNVLYTYNNLVTARSTYTGFASSTNTTNNKIEVAAFLAHVAHETSYLVYTDELSYTPGWYCAAGVYNNWDTHYLCASGADYHGRGPLQLSWNYNYKMASNGMYYATPGGWISVMTPTVGADIWTNPNLVTSDGVLTWKTALWYWMNHGKDWDPAKATPHDHISPGNLGFGETTRDINGGLECNGANPAQMQDRANIYSTFLSNLGVSDTRTKTC